MKRQLNSSLLRAGAALLGFLFSLMGILVIFSLFAALPDSRALTLSDHILIFLGAFVFIITGAALFLFSFNAKNSAMKFGAAAFLLFLLAFNWIAFAPGERNFSRTTSSSFTKPMKFKTSETEGRIVFGVVAGALDFFLLYSYIKSKQRKH